MASGSNVGIGKVERESRKLEINTNIDSPEKFLLTNKPLEGLGQVLYHFHPI